MTRTQIAQQADANAERLLLRHIAQNADVYPVLAWRINSGLADRMPSFKELLKVPGLRDAFARFLHQETERLIKEGVEAEPE
jgi:hypothetical protein